MSSSVQIRAIDYVQMLYDNLGFEDHIVWDSYRRDQKESLRSKVSLTLGLPEKPESSADDSKKKDYEKRLKAVENICENIWSQAKYTGGPIFMAISCVCAVPRKVLTVGEAHYSVDFAVLPIFRVMRCISDLSTEKCCMTFVDTHGRVYRNWEAYKNENIIPDCFIVAPKNGILTGKKDSNGKWRVQTENFLSPAGRIGRKIVNGADKACMAVAAASTGLLVGSFFCPPMLCVMPYVTIAGYCTTVWAVGRSAEELYDRIMHEQSVSLKDPNARMFWITTVAGVLGLAAGASMIVLGSLAINGHVISSSIECLVDGLNCTNIGFAGLGIVNGIFHVGSSVLNGEPVSVLQVAQISALTFVFFHSVCNFQRAKTIIENNQNRTIQDLKEKLDSIKKGQFEQLAEKMMSSETGSAGRADFIRSLKSITVHKEIFSNNLPANEVSKNTHGVVGSALLGATNLLLAMTKETSIDREGITIGLANVAKKLNEKAFEKFVQVVKNFIQEYGDEFERRARRKILLKEYIDAIFEKIEEIAEEMKVAVDRIIDQLSTRVEENIFFNRDIRREFEAQSYPEPNIECSVCVGYYKKTYFKHGFMSPYVLY
uniref:DUF4781 domain-containing protein n=1 Tax=Lutzomyia longipalpis TaxID=7200 RepID=A0A1B0EV64_LUTLO